MGQNSTTRTADADRRAGRDVGERDERERVRRVGVHARDRDVARAERARRVRRRRSGEIHYPV